MVTLLAAELIVENPNFIAMLLYKPVKLHPKAISVAYARATEAGAFTVFNDLLRDYFYLNDTPPLGYVDDKAPEFPVSRAYVREHFGADLFEK